MEEKTPIWYAKDISNKQKGAFMYKVIAIQYHLEAIKKAKQQGREEVYKKIEEIINRKQNPTKNTEHFSEISKT